MILMIPNFMKKKRKKKKKSECGKMRTRITLNTDTFHAVPNIRIVDMITVFN